MKNDRGICMITSQLYQNVTHCCLSKRFHLNLSIFQYFQLISQDIVKKNNFLMKIMSVPKVAVLRRFDKAVCCIFVGSKVLRYLRK